MTFALFNLNISHYKIVKLKSNLKVKRVTSKITKLQPLREKLQQREVKKFYYFDFQTFISSSLPSQHTFASTYAQSQFSSNLYDDDDDGCGGGALQYSCTCIENTHWNNVEQGKSLKVTRRHHPMNIYKKIFVKWGRETFLWCT